MDRVEKTVFLSYRRTNIPWALAIFQNLTQHGFDVFFDYNGISSGDFERVILGNIISRAHFLVLLTPSALERCQEPEDWLRREIETALSSQRNIVPLMLESFDFAMPGISDQLEGALAGLKNYNGLRIPPDYFDAAMERLRTRFLNVPLTAVLHPVSVSAQRAASEQKAAAIAAPTVRQTELKAPKPFEKDSAAADVQENVPRYTGTSPGSRLLPLSTELRLAYQHLFESIEEVIENASDLDLLAALNVQQVQVGNVLTKDNMYHLRANADRLNALKQQIEQTNEGLETLKQRISSIAGETNQVGKIVAAINNVLSLRL